MDSLRLDVAMAERGLARSRTQASELITRGNVSVDGEVITKPGARISQESQVNVVNTDHYVSRAAHKLIAGLDVFGVDPAGKLVLDIGASTGGFTQVLLERGAREVIALDVGHGQLAASVRADARVHMVEGFNARDLNPLALAAASGVSESAELVVADISFISLELVLPGMISVACDNAEFVLLIKPQFEVGKGGTKSGIVSDSELAVAAVKRVINTAAGLGMQCRGVTASPLRGEYGNQEVVAHFLLTSESQSAPTSAHGRAAGTDTTEWNKDIRIIFQAGGAQ